MKGSCCDGDNWNYRLMPWQGSDEDVASYYCSDSKRGRPYEWIMKTQCVYSCVFTLTGIMLAVFRSVACRLQLKPSNQSCSSAVCLPLSSLSTSDLLLLIIFQLVLDLLQWTMQAFLSICCPISLERRRKKVISERGVGMSLQETALRYQTGSSDDGRRKQSAAGGAGAALLLSAVILLHIHDPSDWLTVSVFGSQPFNQRRPVTSRRSAGEDNTTSGRIFQNKSIACFSFHNNIQIEYIKT